MRDVQLVVCGLGGQGVIFLSRVLAEAAMREGRDILTAETHGMAQRGGAVESHIKIGSFASSIVRQCSADAVVVLDAGRLASARRFLGADGRVFVNATAEANGFEACDAGGIAREAGVPRATNLVLLGFASAAGAGLFPAQDALLGALRAVSPDAAREGNCKAFGKGVAAAR